MTPVQGLFPLYPTVSNGLHLTHIVLTNSSSHLTCSSRVKGCWLSLGTSSGNLSSPSMSFASSSWSAVCWGLKVSKGEEVVGRCWQFNNCLLVVEIVNFFSSITFTLLESMGGGQDGQEDTSFALLVQGNKGMNGKVANLASHFLLKEPKMKNKLPAPLLTGNLRQEESIASAIPSVPLLRILSRQIN